MPSPQIEGATRRIRDLTIALGDPLYCLDGRDPSNRRATTSRRDALPDRLTILPRDSHPGQARTPERLYRDALRESLQGLWRVRLLRDALLSHNESRCCSNAMTQHLPRG